MVSRASLLVAPAHHEHSTLGSCAKVVGYTAISMARRIALLSFETSPYPTDKPDEAINDQPTERDGCQSPKHLLPH